MARIIKDDNPRMVPANKWRSVLLTYYGSQLYRRGMIPGHGFQQKSPWDYERYKPPKAPRPPPSESDRDRKSDQSPGYISSISSHTLAGSREVTSQHGSHSVRSSRSSKRDNRSGGSPRPSSQHRSPSSSRRSPRSEGSSAVCSSARLSGHRRSRSESKRRRKHGEESRSRSVSKRRRTHDDTDRRPGEEDSSDEEDAMHYKYSRSPSYHGSHRESRRSSCSSARGAAPRSHSSRQSRRSSAGSIVPPHGVLKPKLAFRPGSARSSASTASGVSSISSNSAKYYTCVFSEAPPLETFMSPENKWDSLPDDRLSQRGGMHQRTPNGDILPDAQKYLPLTPRRACKAVPGISIGYGRTPYGGFFRWPNYMD